VEGSDTLHHHAKGDARATVAVMLTCSLIFWPLSAAKALIAAATELSTVLFRFRTRWRA
jgi:hypothetical protein